MKKGMLLSLIIGVALLGAAGFASLAGASPIDTTPSGATPQSLANPEGNYNYQPGGIWVTGQGKVTVVPDVAILSLGVEAQASTVEQATNQAAAAMDRVMATLEANGVADRDIETQWFNIYPVTRWTDYEEVLVGYRVTNMATVKIRDVEAVGGIIDAVARAGGDLTRIHGVSFTVDDPSLYYDQARAEAVADAIAKARQLATLAGVGLGQPFYISESGGFVPVYYDYGIAMLEASGASTPISPGETEITITVSMAFAIQ